MPTPALPTGTAPPSGNGLPTAYDGSPKPSEHHGDPQPPPVAPPGSAPPPLTGFWDRQVAAQLTLLQADEDQQRLRRRATFLLFAAVPGTMLSAVIHMVLLIVLGLVMMISTKLGGSVISIEVVEAERVEEDALEELVFEMEPLPEILDSQPLPDAMAPEKEIDVAAETVTLLDGPEGASSLEPLVSEPVLLSAADPGESVPGGLSLRGQRRQHALAYGATAESENAVDLALQWLVRHQKSDGSWTFQHQVGDHQCLGCRCGDQNHMSAPMAATAMGVLPLLGAGNTHLHGRYRKQVEAGLRYLIDHQKADGDLRDAGGRMYSHGLAALALCEALAMVRYDGVQTPAGQVDPELSLVSDDLPRPITERELAYAAQRAVTFIERAQHGQGGWRYQPRQAGDMSVVGWQMMALRSAQIAQLDVNPVTLNRAVKFLDRTASDRIGSCYGYTSGNAAAPVSPTSLSIGATTPIGLLCRMYTGWKHEQPGLVMGVRRIESWARPDKGLYFYYYATQVMHHYRGSSWVKWNAWMRDYLVKTQSRQGSEAGSWKLNGSHDDAGRLYCTALATMTLEVYYRYSPIYGQQALSSASLVERPNTVEESALVP